MAEVAAPIGSSMSGSRSLQRELLLESLRQEFGVPFALLEPRWGRVMSSPENYPCDLGSPHVVQLVRRVATDGQAELWSGRSEWQLLAIPVWRRDRVRAVAIGAVKAWDDTSSPACVHDTASRSAAQAASRHLERWAQTYATNQRLNDQLRCVRAQAVETSGQRFAMLDRLAGRLAISDQPERFQSFALRAVAESLAAGCFAWAPPSRGGPVSVVGDKPLPVELIRELVETLAAHHSPEAGSAIIENDVHASSDRAYRARRAPDEVADNLRRGAGQQWDPKVVAAAMNCWEEIIAIGQRGLGQSLRVAVDDALRQDYPRPQSSLVASADQ